MSSLSYYDSERAPDLPQANLDLVRDPDSWDGVDTNAQALLSNLFNESAKPLGPEHFEQLRQPSGSSKLDQSERDSLNSGKLTATTRKPSKAESRPRRTYACGPCKRYKMKCNLDKPCYSCVLSKRVEDCLKYPAHPPSEEEKFKIERRRRRNTRKKDLVQNRVRTPKVWPEVLDNVSPCIVNGSPKHELLLLATSELSPNAVKTLSPMGRDYVFNLNVPLATDFVAPPACQVRRIQNFKFMKEFAVACQQQTVELPHETAAEVTSLLQNVSYDACVKFFQKYADMESQGIQYLVDIKDYFNIAHNLIVKHLQIALGCGSVVLDGFSMRGLSLTALIFAYKEFHEGRYSWSQRWVKVSQDLMAALGDPDSLEDLLHYGTWVVMMKIPLLLGNEYSKIVSLCESMAFMISNSFEFMQFICFKNQKGAGCLIPASELNMLTLNLSDSFKKRGCHDKFVAVARIWSLLKFFEVEVSVMSASGTLQLKYLHLHATIQPNEFLLSLVFGENLSKLQDNWTYFQFILSICGRFFGRFDHFSSPSDLIYSYLTLYNDLHSMLEPTQARLYSELPLMEPVAFIEKHSDQISMLIMKYYLNVRWLTITKVEEPHFPSLRFAHYVTNLMVLHRLMQVLDTRLTGSGDLNYDPAYLDDNMQVNVYLVFFHADKNMLVLQVLYNAAYQAIFLAVLSQFVHDSRFLVKIDLSYIFGQIHDSLSFVRAKIESIAVLREVPIVANLRSFIEFLHDFAVRPAFITPNLPEFLSRISTTMSAATWNSLSLICFGSQTKSIDYISRLWKFFTCAAITEEPFKVLNHLCIDTAFFRSFENSLEPFNFPVQLVDDYIKDVVLPAAES